MNYIKKNIFSITAVGPTMRIDLNRTIGFSNPTSQNIDTEGIKFNMHGFYFILDSGVNLFIPLNTSEFQRAMDKFAEIEFQLENYYANRK